MIPTLTDLTTSNDNDSSLIEASKDAEQISVLYRKIANDQANIENSVNKTMSRMISRHNDHDRLLGTILATENDNARESHVRPHPLDSEFAVNKTMDRILARHNMPEEEGFHLFSHENDDNKDFYSLARREPTEEDHNETLERITRASERREEHGDTYVDSLPNSEDRKSSIDYLKSIDNTSTNILDVLKSMHEVQKDEEEGKSVASQRAREMDQVSGHGLNPRDLESLSDAIVKGLKGDKEEPEDDNKPDKAGVPTKLAKAARDIGTGVIGAGIAAVTTGIGKLLPHNDPAPTGGFDGSQQNANDKASNPTRKTGAIPKEIEAPAAFPYAGKKPLNLKGQKQQNASLLAAALKDRGYNNREIANLLAQAEDESGFMPRSEVISVKRANETMGGRMGNARNEGFKYRGRGLIQLTGKDNYRRYGKMIGMGNQLVDNPDLANDPTIATKIAAAYYSDREKMLHIKNYNDIRDATRATAPKNFEQDNRDRAELAQKYSDAIVNNLIKQGKNKGALFNQESAMNTANGMNVNVTNNNQNTTNVNSGAQTQAPSKPPIPSARSHFWDGWSSYFGL